MNKALTDSYRWKWRPQGKVVQKTWDWYAWLWFHTEFWLEPDQRKPYTYLIREVYHGAPALTVLILGTISYCLGRWWLVLSPRTFLIAFAAILAGIILGHLFWNNDSGAKRQTRQQQR
jgi:hypothetical protein